MATQAIVAEIEIESGWSASFEPTDSDAAEALDRLFDNPNRSRPSIVAAGSAADVSGHSMSVTVDVTMTDTDDVAGHAFTLRFPDIESAQRLRLKLAAGVILAASLTLGGTIVATELTAQPHVGAPDIAVPAAPARPFISRGLEADIVSGDIIQEEAVPTRPFVSGGLQADIRSGDIVQEENATPGWARRPAKN
ncbi:MAG TPA: hypothetical protein VKR24_09695 [Candidatus Limnocylindrales bacterium]|nr:hypothetical protein [Candidatus Limnocylindrales bacterium]